MDTNTVLTAIGGATVVNTMVTFGLNVVIGKRLDAKNNAQLESIKVSLSTGLERAKHDLLIEQSRRTFILENQRESFTRVIRAMHKATQAVEDKFDYGEERWRSISESVLIQFEASRVSESLYTGDEGDLALLVFKRELSACVATPLDFDIDSDSVRSARNKLLYIAARIQEFFRTKIGTSQGNPLSDVFRLDAIRVINLSVSKKQRSIPQELQFTDDTTPSLIVAQCKKHAALLLEALHTLVHTLDDSPGGGFFFEYRELAQRYLAILNGEIKGNMADLS